MALKSVLPASKSRPKAQWMWASPLMALGEQLSTSFTLSTWLLVGACAQSILFFFLHDYRYVLLPAFFILSFRIVEGFLMMFNVIPNRYMEDVLIGRYTAIAPNKMGIIDEKKREKVVILSLGTKSNHPMGLFAPEFIKMGVWIKKMGDQFESEDECPEGFLGQTYWNRRDERGAVEVTLISYWRSIEDLHNFAHSPLHREAWMWWEKTLKQHNFLGINHEIFEAPAGHWENVYLNFQPTGFGATTYLKKGGKFEGGVLADEYVSPLVDARRGKLSRSSARIGIEEIEGDKDRPSAELYA